MTLFSFGHIDIAWEDPGFALFLRTLAPFSRLIVFDPRGRGASDPLPQGSLPPWESYGEDLVAVLDEVGSEQAAIMGQLDASRMAIVSSGPDPSGPARSSWPRPAPSTRPAMTT